MCSLFLCVVLQINVCAHSWSCFVVCLKNWVGHFACRKMSISGSSGRKEALSCSILCIELVPVLEHASLELFGHCPLMLGQLLLRHKPHLQIQCWLPCAALQLAGGRTGLVLTLLVGSIGDAKRLHHCWFLGSAWNYSIRWIPDAMFTIHIPKDLGK